MNFETGVKNYLKKQDKAITRVLRQQANYIKQEAVKITPMDTGALRDSAVVEDGKDTKYIKEDRVAFKSDYAVYVHEDLTVNHPFHKHNWCDGQAKFLENTMMDKSKLVLKEFSKVIEV